MNNRGFTLIEMLVVIGIIGILSTLAVGYSRGNDRRLVLFAEQAKLVSIVNKAKRLALDKYKSTANALNKVCGYGVHFNNLDNSYTIYEIVSSAACSSIINPVDYCYSGSSLTINDVERFTLDQRVVFGDFSELRDYMDVAFIPPNLEVQFCPTGSALPAVLTLESADNPSINSSVSISAVGQVSVQ